MSGGPGASFMHSGIFDLDANPGRVRDISIPDDSSFADNLVSLSAAAPNHPYSVALAGPDGEDLFVEAVSFFFNALKKSGLEVEGSFNDRLLLANNLGTLKRSRFALKSLAAGDLRNHDSMKIAVIGIAGLAEFDSKFTAASAGDLLPRATGSYLQSFEAFEMELPGLEGFSNLTPYSIAQMMDAPGFGDVFAGRVEETVNGVFTHAAFPAVLGVERHAEVVSRLERALGAVVFEIATVQPSAPGKRIMIAIEKQLAAAGVKSVRGRAAGFTAAGGEITSVLVETPNGGAVEITAAAAVLATGKFLAGGLVHDAAIREPLFGLPVFTESGPAADKTPLVEYVTNKIAERQQIVSCGAGVSEKLRALGRDGRPLFGNLFCAGSVIRGYDPYRDGCGTGVAAVTGYIAGKNAAEFIKIW